MNGSSLVNASGRGALRSKPAYPTNKKDWRAKRLGVKQLAERDARKETHQLQHGNKYDMHALQAMTLEELQQILPDMVDVSALNVAIIEVERQRYDMEHKKRLALLEKLRKEKKRRRHILKKNRDSWDHFWHHLIPA